MRPYIAVGTEHRAASSNREHQRVRVTYKTQNHKRRVCLLSTSHQPPASVAACACTAHRPVTSTRTPSLACLCCTPTTVPSVARNISTAGPLRPGRICSCVFRARETVSNSARLTGGVFLCVQIVQIIDDMSFRCKLLQIVDDISIGVAFRRWQASLKQPND